MATNVCVDGDDFETNDDGQLVLKLGECGLKHSPQGIQANVQTWPYPCPAVLANGSGIYCDESTGRLIGPPAQRAFPIAASNPVSGPFPQPVNPGGKRCSDAAEVNVSTVNICDTILLDVDLLAEWTVFADEGADYSVYMEQSNDGDPFIPAGILEIVNNATGNFRRRHTRGMASRAFKIWAPNSGNRSYGLRICVENNSPAGSGLQLQVGQLEPDLRGMLHTYAP